VCGWRIIPLSPETVEICQHYLHIREQFLTKPIKHRDRRPTVRTLQTEAFFCSWRGERLLTVISSLRSSSRMRSIPHNGLSGDIAVMRLRASALSLGRPG
jgi:hypothetical protein